MSLKNSAAVHCTVDITRYNAHIFQVTLHIAKPQSPQNVALPAWIPGSYLMREFSKNLQNLKAQQGGRAVAVLQQNKSQWTLDCQADQALTLHYEVYALDASVRTAWLDSQRGFFNATSLCLQVQGQEELPHALTLLPIVNKKPLTAASTGVAGWHVATGLSSVKVNRQGFGTYTAANYDELADCPIEMGHFWRGEFTACGIAHSFVVAGALPSFDHARLIADTQKICETQLRFWHSSAASDKRAGAVAPHQTYIFMLNAVDEGYGGLEHRNSTALICKRKDLPQVNASKASEGYVTLLGLISHEYFHTWNVKQLRPAEFTRYNYTQENYTQLLWFFEGFTSYYDDLLLRRSGLIDDTTYFKLLNKTINQVLQTPGRLVQSVAQSSFDAWVKYYRQDENTPNATVSYYSKGALVALCLDLALRSEGASNLDHVMRGLWQRCQGGPMREEDLLTELKAQTGRSWKKEIKAWVHSTSELPLKKFLITQSVQVHQDPPQMAQRLGLRATETQGFVHIKSVLRGGAAEKAGMAAGDEWWALEVSAPPSNIPRSKSTPQRWRLRKLDELTSLLGTQAKAVAWVSRDQRMLELPFALPSNETTWRLSAGERSSAWPAA